MAAEYLILACYLLFCGGVVVTLLNIYWKVGALSLPPQGLIVKHIFFLKKLMPFHFRPGTI